MTSISFAFIMTAVVVVGVTLSFIVMLAAAKWCIKVNPRIAEFIVTKLLRRA